MNIFILKGKFLKPLNSFGEKKREKRQTIIRSLTLVKKPIRFPWFDIDMKKVKIVAGKSLPGVKSTFIKPHDMTFIIVLTINFHMSKSKMKNVYTVFTNRRS